MLFTACTATKSGGAVYNMGDAALRQVTFSAGSANKGGAVYNGLGASLLATESTFEGLEATR